jgi:archaellum component FlaG (FlaF/FlaG flagellin family)
VDGGGAAGKLPATTHKDYPQGSDRSTDGREGVSIVRRAIVIVCTVAFVVAIPAFGLASHRAQQGGAHVNCTASRSSAAAVTTTSTTFSTIPAYELGVESVFGMSESVTLVMSGSPVYVKVIDTSVGGSSALDPGQVTIQTTADNNTASITFVTLGAAAPHLHTLDVEWRLKSSGGSATIKRGAVNLLYEAGDSGCPFV